MAEQVWGLLAGLCGLAGYLAYLAFLARRRAWPSRLAWLIWCPPPAVVLASLAVRGVPAAALWLPAAQLAGTWITAGCVLRYGHRRPGPAGRRRAVLSGTALAAAALAVWWQARSPAAALLIALGIEECGMALTIAGAYARPGGEPSPAWALFAAAGLLGLPAAGTRAPAVAYLYLATFTTSAIMVIAAGWLGSRRRPAALVLPVQPADHDDGSWSSPALACSATRATAAAGIALVSGAACAA